MLGGHLHFLLVAGSPATHRLKAVRLRRVACFALAPFEGGSHLLDPLIHAPILRCADHKVRLLLSAR
jgi:hypothetical protein